jgi:hypothetical protein
MTPSPMKRACGTQTAKKKENAWEISENIAAEHKSDGRNTEIERLCNVCKSRASSGVWEEGKLTRVRKS